jgi:uncharacterized SAM-binding protein YcdF (DUF218 family)
MPRRRITLLALAVALVLVGGSLYLFRRQVLQAVGDFLMVHDDLQPVGVIHVIAGQDDRTDYAIQLYKQGYGTQLFFTGGWCSFRNYYHGQHGRELALAQGVPSEAIAVDDSPVTSTYSETLRLNAFIVQNPVPVRSVIVVSDAYHMRRARWTARRLLGKEIKVQMAPVPFEMSSYSRQWWTDDVSRRYVQDEYLKMAYYVARYQLSWGPLQEWLEALDSE